MTRWAWTVALALVAGQAAAADKVKEEEAEGYLEWRQGEILIVDGQKVTTTAGTKFKGKDQATSVGAIPIGFEVKAKGIRGTDGSLIARELEAKPNGSALFEKDVRSMTDQAESEYRKAGRFFNTLEGGKTETVGWMFDSGPKVDRARRIVDNLLPPYVDASQVRRLRDREPRVERLRHGQLLDLRVQRDHGRPRRRRARDRARPRDRPRHPRAHAQAVQEGDVDPAGGRRCRGAAEEIDDKNKRAVPSCWCCSVPRPGRTATAARWRTRRTAWGCATRTRAATTSPRAPPVAALRQEVRRVGQGRELLLQRPLALVGARASTSSASSR
jgi:hypothetical protein